MCIALHVITAMMAWLTTSFVSGEAVVACPSKIISMNISTYGDIHGLTDALNCTGGGVYEISWFRSLRIGRRIEVVDHKNVTITGYGYPILRAGLVDVNKSNGSGTDAGGTSGMFLVSNGSTLTVKHIALDGGYSEGGGGAVAALSSSYLRVFGCVFSSNVASVGGAIYANQSEIHIDGVTKFVNDSAQDGGAIYASKSDVFIDGNASFSRNLALSHGGAICATESKVNIVGNVRFSNNSGASYGGAMSASSKSEVHIGGNTVFAHNSASYAGGAVIVYGGELKIEGNTTFAFNNATYLGGAICASAVDIYISGITAFANNTAEARGGAIYLYGESKGVIDGITDFSGNSVTYGGGALFADKSDVKINGTTIFSDNSASVTGGGIRQQYGNLTIDGDTTFTANTASTGGGIDTNIGNMVIKRNTLFAANSAEARGGAIVISQSIKSSITNASFTSNTAPIGGAIALWSPFSNERTYDDCVFIGNTAADGGAMYLYGDSGRDIITGSVFRENYASTSGGAIFLTGKLTLNSTGFEANTAGAEGPVINGVSVLSLVEFANVWFKDNAYHCPVGEYGDLLRGVNTSRFDTVCEKCRSSTSGSGVPDGVDVDDESGTPSCQELPTGTVGRSSGTTVSSLALQGGYYRTSSQSMAIMACYRPEACEGGDDSDTYCAIGYEGPYCAVCAERFSPRIAYRCGKCSEETRRSAVGLAVATFVVVVVVVAVLLKHLGSVADSDGRGAGARRISIQRKCVSFQNSLMKVLPLTAIKIVVVVWQIVFQFSAIAGEVYPEEYERFLSYLSFFHFDIGMMISYSCLFSPDFYGRLVLATVTPLAVIASLAGAYFATMIVYNSSNRQMRAVQRKLLSAGLFFIFFVYSSVSYTIFQTFICDPLDDGEVYLQADYSLTCSTKRHKVYINYAIAMIVVYPIGIPALFFWWLFRNRMYLKLPDRQTVAHLQPFCSFWGTYRPSRYYYEVVECCRRIALTLASVFLVPNSVNQIAVVLLLAVAFVVISETMSPFESSTDMSLYRWGNGVVVASMFVALLVKANDSNEDKSGMLSVFGVVLITANLVMIGAVVAQSVFLAKNWQG